MGAKMKRPNNDNFSWLVAFLLWSITLSVTSATVFVSPHNSLLSSSLDLRPASSGLVMANSSLTALEVAMQVRGSNITKSAQGLLGTVIRTGRFRLSRVRQAFQRLEEFGLDGGRVRRELANPFYSVGDAAGWLFGLVTHDNFQQFKSQMQGNLEVLQKEEEDVEEAVAANTKALNESLGLLQKFEGWMDRLLEENDDLIASEKFAIKIMRLKFELDTCLGSLEGLANILVEVLDRGDAGLASRHLFGSDHLSRHLLVLNDRHPGLSPIFSASTPSKYFQLPLAITSSNSTHLRSILRIPLVDPDSTFHNEEQQLQEGLVGFHNARFSTFLTFPEYEECVRDNRGATTFCNLRPCLVTRSGRERGIQCFALNSTNFLLSDVSSPLQSKCGGILQQVETNKDAKDGFKHLSLAPYCQIHSTDFLIKQVETEATTSIPEEDLATLSSIFSVHPEAIVVEKTNKEKRRMTMIRVEAGAIIRQLNSSLLLHKKKKKISSSSSTTQSLPHLVPVAVAGGSIGTIAIVAALLLFVLLIIRR